jgi:protein KTI12
VVVVVDALNYIKGFRYQMFCSAKALSTCTVNIFCVGGDETSELGSRFEPPQEKNRWDRPLILARRNAEGKMEFDEAKVMEAVGGKVSSRPNLSTINEPRKLAGNSDQELNECIAEIMQNQKDGGNSGLPRHVSMAELRLWKREYLQLMDLADVKQTQNVKTSFLKFCSVKVTGDD